MDGQIVVQCFLKDIAHHAFSCFQNFLAVGKGKFHINLGKFRLTVTAGIFITVAAGNLEIFVKATHHQKLLVELR